MNITVSQLRKIIKEEVSNVVQAGRTKPRKKSPLREPKFSFEYPSNGKTMKLGQFEVNFYKEPGYDEVFVNFTHPDLGAGNDPISAFAELIESDIENYSENLRREWEETMTFVEEKSIQSQQ